MPTNNAVNISGSGIVSYDGAGVFSALANPLTVSNGGSGISSTSAYAVLCAGTSASGALQNVSGVGTSSQVLVSNGSSSLPTWQTMSSSGNLSYTVCCSASGTALDASTYYLARTSNNLQTYTNLNSGVANFFIPKNGTINTFQGIITVGGTLGSSENCTLALRKNNTTDTNLSTTIQLTSASTTLNFTSIGLSVVAGDYISVKFVTPTWATNPTLVGFAATFFLDV